MNKRFIQTMILSLLIPCIACAIQWVFWDKLQPFTWILFYPALFFSAQVGGRWGGGCRHVALRFAGRLLLCRTKLFIAN